MKIPLQDFRPPSSWFHITVYPTLTPSHHMFLHRLIQHIKLPSLHITSHHHPHTHIQPPHVSSSPYTTYQTPITPHHLPPSPPHSHPATTCFFITLYNISNSHHSTSPPTITPTLTSSHHMFLHRLIQHIKLPSLHITSHHHPHTHTQPPHVSSSPYTTYQTPITPHHLPPSPPHSHPATTCFFIALYNISNSHHSTSPPTIAPTLTSSHHMFLHRLIQHIKLPSLHITSHHHPHTHIQPPHVSSSPYTTYQTPITPHHLPPSPPHSHPATTCFFIALYNISNSHHSTSPPTITPTLTPSHHMFLHRLIQHIKLPSLHITSHHHPHTHIQPPHVSSSPYTTYQTPITPHHLPPSPPHSHPATTCFFIALYNISLQRSRISLPVGSARTTPLTLLDTIVAVVLDTSPLAC